MWIYILYIKIIVEFIFHICITKNDKNQVNGCFDFQDFAWERSCPLSSNFEFGGRRRGFLLSSSVSSSLGVIFVFASLFPTLFLLIVAVFVINYGLECFANLGIAYIYHSTYQLFEYKFCIGKFFFGGLNIYKCFIY